MPEITAKKVPEWAFTLKIGTVLKVSWFYKDFFKTFTIKERVSFGGSGDELLYTIISHSVKGVDCEHTFVSPRTIFEYCLEPKPDTLDIEGDYYQ